MTSPPGTAPCGASSSAEMGVTLASQGRELLWALVWGLGVGLCYDLLRPLRRRAGKLPAAMLDGLFSLLAGLGAFLYAMGVGGGRAGLWALTCMLLGFLLYLHFPSRLLLPAITAGETLFLNLMASCKKILVKSAISLKLFFQNMRK